jgi:gamma-glutamyltranspeptidase/glutathione hydrolase
VLTAPFTTVRSPGGAVCSADHLATSAGIATLARGGNAVDAAVAVNAVLAVTGAHMCGLGGDLFALVHRPGREPVALNASGRAPGSADAATLRAEGHTAMPFRHDPRTVTVPGCVDGWCELHRAFGTLPLAEVLAPAIRLATRGFPASPLLVGSLALTDQRARQQLAELASQAARPGARVRRPGVARTLAAIAEGGREAFYAGEFGTGLVDAWPSVFATEDLAARQADWVGPLHADAWGARVWTTPPNSQGFLAVGAAAIAAGLDLPDDPDDPLLPHLLVEAAKAMSHDRPARLFDGADGPALLDRSDLDRRRAGIGPRAAALPAPGTAGDTTYLCTVDADGMAVSLIQSNASGFGSWLVEPATGINLHNRGLGFSLAEGHPAELRPGARPPHTLLPLLVTGADGSLRAVLGTMGGDGQPQIVLQVLARLLRYGQGTAAAIAAPRWVLRGPVTGFDTWTSGTTPAVVLEGHAPADWADALAARGHRVDRVPAFDAGVVGHAHAIVVDEEGMRCAAADPRTVVGSAAGI